MAEKETKTNENKVEVGMVTLTGEVGLGVMMPEGNVVELHNVDPGTAQILGYLVKTLSEVRKNI